MRTVVGATSGPDRSDTIGIAELGWDPETVGEIDHRLLKAPSVKLRSISVGTNGDAVYSIDLRVRRPNTGRRLTGVELHSLEHFLLEGFRRHLAAHFVSVGVMGCRTGFYLVFLNEGRADKICMALEEILKGIREATAVPYARIDQCGDYRSHSLERARRLAVEILERRSAWLISV